MILQRRKGSIWAQFTRINLIRIRVHLTWKAFSAGWCILNRNKKFKWKLWGFTCFLFSKQSTQLEVLVAIEIETRSQALSMLELKQSMTEMVVEARWSFCLSLDSCCNITFEINFTNMYWRCSVTVHCYVYFHEIYEYLKAKMCFILMANF